MNRHVKVTLLALAVVTLAAAATTAPRRSQEQAAAPQVRGQLPDRSHYPVADYDAPEPADPEQRAKRRARSARYDDQGGVPSPHHKDKWQGIQRVSHWDVGLPALPVAESSIVAVGQVTDARAHLSNNKKGVYSEFTFQVEEVLKNSESNPVAPGNSIFVSREGGRVRFPDGEIALFLISGQDMPRVGRRYVLFLKADGAGDGYSILTGYELAEGRVMQLDNRGVQKTKFAAYNGMDEAAFIQTIKNLLASPSQP